MNIEKEYEKKKEKDNKHNPSDYSIYSYDSDLQEGFYYNIYRYLKIKLKILLV